jgi:hypothetical protein
MNFFLNIIFNISTLNNLKKYIKKTAGGEDLSRTYYGQFGNMGWWVITLTNNNLVLTVENYNDDTKGQPLTFTAFDKFFVTVWHFEKFSVFFVCFCYGDERGDVCVYIYCYGVWEKVVQLYFLNFKLLFFDIFILF